MKSHAVQKPRHEKVISKSDSCVQQENTNTNKDYRMMMTLAHIPWLSDTYLLP